MGWGGVKAALEKQYATRAAAKRWFEFGELDAVDEFQTQPNEVPIERQTAMNVETSVAY